MLVYVEQARAGRALIDAGIESFLCDSYAGKLQVCDRLVLRNP